jgi:class 3 adenylate cyclase
MDRTRCESYVCVSALAEFASVLDTVQAAVETQNSLAETKDALPQDRRVEFRIGLNIGDVMVKDVFGDSVNIAARLESLAEPGGICVSRECGITSGTCWREYRAISNNIPRTPLRR